MCTNRAFSSSFNCRLTSLVAVGNYLLQSRILLHGSWLAGHLTPCIFKVGNLLNVSILKILLNKINMHLHRIEGLLRCPAFNGSKDISMMYNNVF